MEEEEPHKKESEKNKKKHQHHKHTNNKKKEKNTCCSVVVPCFSTKATCCLMSKVAILDCVFLNGGKSERSLDDLETKQGSLDHNTHTHTL